MDRNANYALVGVVSAVLLVGLVIFSLWLATFKVGASYDIYDIVFKGPVSGLSEQGCSGSPRTLSSLMALACPRA